MPHLKDDLFLYFRNSNCIDNGPPPKLIKSVHDHRFIRDETNVQRSNAVKKSFLGSMGSIFSRAKSHSNACEPAEFIEYSDEEDLYVVQKFKKRDLNMPQQTYQFNNSKSNEMDALDHRPKATRPPPGLIPKKKFSRVPDLQKIVPPPIMRMNGYEQQNENQTTGSYLLNGNNLSFKPHNTIDNTVNLGRNFSNYINVDSQGGVAAKLLTLTPRNQTEDFKKYQKLLESVCPQNSQDILSLPTSSSASYLQNHITNTKPISRKSVHSLSEDDFKKKAEDATTLFRSCYFSDLEELKVKPVNTVRLRIESIPACNPSFSENMKERHSNSIKGIREKIALLQKEAGNLTTLRQKFSESYERLVPDWIVPEPIILSEDVEEKIDDFPEFTESQKQVIRQAMVGNPKTILINKFNFQITRDDISTLQWEPDLKWLNDEVINFYMSLLTERGSQEGYSKVYAMNTFFIQRLFSGGYSAVKRWTKKVDLFACDIIPVPVHVGGIHWCMAIINMKEKTIKYYDSMGGPNNKVLSALEDYLREESLDKRKVAFDLSGWSKENVTNNPRQQNGSDCGVFSCMTAEFICRNRPIIFSQQHMSYFRQKMVLEICTGKLLL
ncbi:Sentrin-specific protease 1 [Pseudolycoriella hygida]|uniref:Sentrin-specific protease 1 n=1 Tax=Pseudolycoriella hygida TaxID=35572 RepID=A0A9Q0MTB6_9DIPT|nr:Sentrin-specific protease 1 [Pseudolycoriella hygida]